MTLIARWYRDREGVYHQQFAGHYNPNEPRDDYGRWAAEGGGARASVAEKALVGDMRTDIKAFMAAHKDTPNTAELRKFSEDVQQKYGDRINAVLDEHQAQNPKQRASVLVQQEPVTVWLLNWPQGMETRPHDHGGSGIGLSVTRGKVGETYYYDNMPVASRELAKGQSLSAGYQYEHNMMNNHPEMASSVHFYYPPLNQVRYYGANGIEVDRFNADTQGG